MLTNIPKVKPDTIAVSRGRFAILLSGNRRAAVEDTARNQPEALPCSTEDPFV